MNDAKVINLCEFIEKEKRDAFKWAEREQKRMGITATKTVNWKAEEDDFISDLAGCVVSIYRDEEANKTIFRRDWPDKGGVSYWELVNFEEMKCKYPLSTQHMLNNGLRIFRYYDGANGGVTRLKEEQYRFIKFT